MRFSFLKKVELRQKGSTKSFFSRSGGEGRDRDSMDTKGKSMTRWTQRGRSEPK